MITDTSWPAGTARDAKTSSARSRPRPKRTASGPPGRWRIAPASSCGMTDFRRFNPAYAQQLYEHQPISDRGVWNQLEYRPLEGFVYAITPFNFTAIGGNLPTAPALMGNTVLWKPASSAMLSAWYTLKLLQEAGLPPGVINFVPGDAPMISEVALSHRDLA